MSGYVFQEYPKWVYPNGEKPFVVNDADEEAAAMGTKPIEETAVETDNKIIAMARPRGRPPKLASKQADSA